MPGSSPAESSSASSPWNLPNAITAVRILLVPVFLWLLLTHSDKHDPLRWWALVVFLVTISTDSLDGAIARRRGLITNLGKILDPIADKALLGGALIGLSILDEVPWWITVVILVRELGITVYRFAVIRKKVIAASGGGKLKTVLQSVAVAFFISPFDLYLGAWLLWFEWALLWAALAITLWSGISYVIAAYRHREDPAVQ